MSEKVTLILPDNSTMQCYVLRPKGKPKAGIILAQEVFGITAHLRRCVARLVEEGFLVIAPELFHRTAHAGAEFSYNDIEVVKVHFQAITVPNLEADIKTAYDWLKENKVAKVGIVGYCLGGRVSFLANASLPLGAAVSYYGRVPAELLPKAKDQSGPILMFWGGADKGITPADVQAQVEALRAAGKVFTNVEFSEAQHGFNCDDRPSFNQEASEQAWALTLAFFKKHLL
jgi:carboxymethylenebutenolidase